MNKKVFDWFKRYLDKDKWYLIISSFFFIYITKDLKSKK